jgi:DtxR family Mn-dependent transcriptional regulator
VNGASDLVNNMIAVGFITLGKEGDFHLTPEGRERALHLIRAHRLWESYLADETGYSEKEWHEQAEDREHRLSESEVAKLSSNLGRPTRDPHGDLIPSEVDSSPLQSGRPLNALTVGESARIVHIEDEPTSVYEGLVRRGLRPGMQIRTVQASDKEIRILAGSDESVLTRIEAANISVVPLSKTLIEQRPSILLSDLKAGERGEILAISSACRGHMRRRLMDLGFLPGTIIKAEMGSPLGDPMAYSVRGVNVALRSEQGSLIEIRRVES